jgi:ferredoxin
MTQEEERLVSGLTVRIDRTLCVGFGDCIDIAPETFALDDEGIATFAVSGEIDARRLLEACEACPVDALTVLAPDGRKLVPR